MSPSFARTIESPCRSCENVHLNKDECSKECDRLRAFQDAILHYDERTIKDFGAKMNYSR
jgi:hypothetical protein